MDGVPVRIGVLHDFPPADGGTDFERALRRGMQPVADAGRLPGDVEVVHQVARGLPLPGGSADSVERAFGALVERGVLAIVGPAITDNALVVLPLAERHGVPCVSYAGAEAGRGEFMFHFQIGSLEEEPAFLAAHLAGRGLRRVALVQDPSYVGRRTAEFFEDAGAVEGIRIVGRIVTTSQPGDLRDDVVTLRAGGPDAVVSLGLWGVARALQRALAAEHWSVPVVANSALIYGYHDPGWAADWESWTYTDTVSDDNPLYRRLAAEAAVEGRAFGPGPAGAHDIGHLLAEGLARTHVLSRAGVRDGLERVKALVPATGEPGTLMGFGRQDRGALKGRFLVVRQWRGGRSVAWRGAP